MPVSVSRKAAAAAVFALILGFIGSSEATNASVEEEKCRDPGFVASCPVSCRLACDNREIFRAATKECIRAADPASRDDPVACRKLGQDLGPKRPDQASRQASELPSGSPEPVETCLAYLKASGPANPAASVAQTDQDDDVASRVFRDRPICATSTRALVSGFSCMKDNHLDIQKNFESMKQRIPTKLDPGTDICALLRHNVLAEDRARAAELLKRGATLVSSLAAVANCSAEYERWLTHRTQECPVNVPDCQGFVKFWQDKFAKDLQTFSTIGADIEDAQNNLERMRNAASMLAYIQAQNCER